MTQIGTGPVPKQTPPRGTTATGPAPPLHDSKALMDTMRDQSQDAAAPAPPKPLARGSNVPSGLFETEYTEQAARPTKLGPATGVRLTVGGRIHQYELIRELGRGGMGMVWAARDTKLGRRVAIKVLHDASRAVADRFLTEARATAQCNHDNIVIIHEVNEIENMPYMVLEFLEGQLLRDLMGPIGSAMRVPVSRVIELMLPVARALARAHELGIVHRDLKPENVFVTNSGQVKVLDFGIAKATSSRSTRPRKPTANDVAPVRDLKLTGEGTMVGTLPYMSPEQMRAEEVDHRADLWAVGIMMYEMLAGHHPIDPLTSEALILNGTSDDPMPSIRRESLDLPEALTHIVDSCLRKPVVERIASATDLATKLENELPGRAGRKLADDESPYPGLTAFQEADANRFFGRTRDIARMSARIRELPITGVVGPSGVGKSSFIRAGVGPALKLSGEPWELVTLRPGRQPLAALASVVQRLTTGSSPDINKQVSEHDHLMQRLRAEPGLIGTLLRARARASNGQILLFVDQFEELYTLVPDAAERKAFTAALAGVADDTTSPLRVVVSMRSDFLDRIAEDPRLMEELSRGLVFLQPPDRSGLREALTAPIDMVGYRFESAAMIEDMLDALVDMPGALPLLQFAAAKLWDARDRHRRMMTVQSYNTIGGISGALATHADDVVAQMNERAQKLTQKVMRALVTPERTRAIVELGDLHQLSPDPTEVARIIDQLVGARLLVVQTRGDAGGGSVEIVHESLIERWPTLRRWLDEDQEDAGFISQLSAAAKQWDAKGRANGLVWRGDAMEEARRWYGQRPRELTARDQAFLDAVFALDRRGRRAKRFALVGAFALLGAIAAGAMVALFWIRGAELQAAREAEVAKRALIDRDKKDAERQAAERRKLEAEAETKQAEADKQKVQVEKAQVEAEKSKLEQMSRAELEAKNVALESSIDEARAARGRAEAEKAKAEKAAAELKKAKDALQAANAKQQAEIDRLKEETRKLTTKLK